MPDVDSRSLADGGMLDDVPDCPRNQTTYADQHHDTKNLPDLRPEFLDRPPALSGF